MSVNTISLLIFIILLQCMQQCISDLNHTIEEQQIANLNFYKRIIEWKAAFQGVGFSGVFTDNSILQRAPKLASVYGLADSPNKVITVTLTNMDNNKIDIYKTNSDMTTNGSTWKVTFTNAYNYGGNYTLNVSCDQCLYSSNTNNILYNVTFGDVYYLAGQSNMELTMHYTLERNVTYADIRNGKYQNIRFYKIDSSLPTGTNVTYVIPYSDQYIWNFASDIDILDDRSAFGWYFAQTLYDFWNIKDIPIGLIDVSEGGSHIEEWIQNQTVQLSCKYSDCPDVGCGYLYGMRVAPYLNMTIKSYLWYQGENNIAENWNEPGYSCMQSFMIQQWRQQWGANDVTPFGLVTLAAGTDEGASGMAEMRMAQLGNYGYTPNPALPRVFSALGHDMGDYWMAYSNHNSHCTSAADDYACVIINDSYIPPWNQNQTNWLMGDIHPRTKKWLAQRLASAGYGILYNNSVYNYMTVGPLISGCSLNNQTWTIVISFNKTFLRGHSVDYQPFVSNGNYYNNTASIQIEIDNNWYYVNMTTEGRKNDNEIIINIPSQYKTKKITGISYGWSKAPCCGLYTNNGFDWGKAPCPVNSCEIKAGGGTNNYTDLQLPAVPFQAKIVNNSCVCTPPQVCDG